MFDGHECNVHKSSSAYPRQMGGVSLHAKLGTFPPHSLLQRKCIQRYWSTRASLWGKWLLLEISRNKVTEGLFFIERLKESKKGWEPLNVQWSEVHKRQEMSILPHPKTVSTMSIAQGASLWFIESGSELRIGSDRRSMSWPEVGWFSLDRTLGWQGVSSYIISGGNPLGLCRTLLSGWTVGTLVKLNL